MNQTEFLTAALRNPVNEAIADELFQLALPDAWLVSGCLVQTVWNVLTGRAVDYGIDDYDVFYFDPDTSWEAEDTVIRQAAGRVCRNSASRSRRATRRAFISGTPKSTACPIRRCAVRREGIDRFLTKNTRSGSAARARVTRSMRRTALTMSPTLIVRPNPGPNFSAANYEAKAARWKALWPEITVLPADAAAVIANGAKHSIQQSRDALRCAMASAALARTAAATTAPRPR